MAKYVIDETTLSNLADAVRAEAKVTDKLDTGGMIKKIHQIPSVTIDDLFGAESAITDIVYSGSFIRTSNAFSHMPNLVSATLPNIQNLPQGTFNNCTSLKKVDLGADCYSVENLAFWGCSSLVAVILRKKDYICRMPSGAFTDTPIASGTGYAYVHKVLLAEYEADSIYVEMGMRFRTIEDYPDICGTETVVISEEG